MENNNEMSIVPYLYSCSTLPELLKTYENDLRKSKDKKNMLHANKLTEYNSVLTDNKFFSDIRKLFDALYSLTKKDYPSLLFHLEGRRKTVISSEKKILLYLSQNKSLDEFRDILAFRFVLFGENSIELVKTCYNLVDTIIDFMISKGYTPCEATQTFETEGFNAADFPEIIIPDHSYLSDDNIHLVKDYIIHSKKSGYQSLHVAFRDSFGRCFEIQVRTFAMHMHAESHSLAGHDFYKNIKYSNTEIEFDRLNVHLNGYAISPSGSIFDYIGLEQPFQIIQKGRTF